MACPSCKFQQSQQRLLAVAGIAQTLQGLLGPVKQAGAEEVLASAYWARSRSSILRSASLHDVLMDPDRAFELATPAEEVAQRKCSSTVSGSCWTALDEGIDGLVLLLIQEIAQALGSRPWAPFCATCH